MKKLLVSAPLFLCIIVFNQSCSKKSGAATPSACQIITVVDSYNGTNTTYNLAYGNNGKISTIQNTSAANPYTEVFTYSGNIILTTETGTGNVFISSDSLVVNTAGLVTFSMQIDASNDTTVNVYTYDGNNNLLKSTYQYNSGTISTNTYQYTNGDLTSSSDGTTTTTYTYNTAKPSENGDYIHISQLFNYGAQAIQTAHLIETITSGSTIDDFNYTFDSSGKITALTLTSGSTVETVTYQYQCN
jgi:hypothetical protein